LAADQRERVDGDDRGKGDGRRGGDEPVAAKESIKGISQGNYADGSAKIAPGKLPAFSSLSGGNQSVIGSRWDRPRKVQLFMAHPSESRAPQSWS
jgi:hypothetical protein